MHVGRATEAVAALLPLSLPLRRPLCAGRVRLGVGWRVDQAPALCREEPSLGGWGG